MTELETVWRLIAETRGQEMARLGKRIHGQRKTIAAQKEAIRILVYERQSLADRRLADAALLRSANDQIKKVMATWDALQAENHKLKGLPYAGPIYFKGIRIGFDV